MLAEPSENGHENGNGTLERGQDQGRDRTKRKVPLKNSAQVCDVFPFNLYACGSCIPVISKFAQDAGFALVNFIPSPAPFEHDFYMVSPIVLKDQLSQ